MMSPIKVGDVMRRLRGCYGSAIVVDRLAVRWALVCVDPDTHQYPTAEVSLGFEHLISRSSRTPTAAVGAPQDLRDGVKRVDFGGGSWEGCGRPCCIASVSGVRGCARPLHASWVGYLNNVGPCRTPRFPDSTAASSGRPPRLQCGTTPRNWNADLETAVRELNEQFQTDCAGASVPGVGVDVFREWRFLRRPSGRPRRA
jgi:hypothetical protein